MFKKSYKGFTLIELLIVIAVLGILAVAVLSAINPIEQINRSKDTGSRSDAEQLISAIDRFYASKGYYPWQEDADSENYGSDGFKELDAEDVVVGTDAGVEMFTNLVGETGELKQSYVTRVINDDKHLFLYKDDSQSGSVYVCFLPKSDSFLDEAEERCIDDDGTGLPLDLRTKMGATICSGFEQEGAARVVYSCLP